MRGIRLEQTWPDSNANRGVRLTPLREQSFGNMQLTLWILLGAVGCANIANMLRSASL